MNEITGGTCGPCTMVKGGVAQRAQAKRKNTVKKKQRAGYSRKAMQHKKRNTLQRSKRKGGGSDWMVVNNARLSSTTDSGFYGPRSKTFSNFAPVSAYVPPSVLDKGWANPKLAGIC